MPHLQEEVNTGRLWDKKIAWGNKAGDGQRGVQISSLELIEQKVKFVDSSQKIVDSIVKNFGFSVVCSAK